MYQLSGSIVLGWALGSNDAANVFGTAVASRMIRFRTAALLASLFVILGAVLQGGAGIQTLGGLFRMQTMPAMIVSCIAGLTVLLMTALKLPVSTSQAVVGAILGMGLFVDPSHVQWSELGKIFSCWVGTPIGAMLIAAIMHPTLGYVLDRLPVNLVTRSIVLKFALLIAGSYGAYALGANNVANVTGMFYHSGLMNGGDNDLLVLTLIGGVSIALGILTYSKNVMFTVGSELVQLGAYSALVAILAEAITVHFYAMVGVPVSTSQAIIGAVLGIGIARGIKTINRRTLLRIVIGWVTTPVIAGGLCFLMAWLAS